MKTEGYKAIVTPGRQVTDFSRDEVAEAMFVARYNRLPTDEEAKRLMLITYDDYGGSRLLSLTFTDEAPAKEKP